jgi:hypothetical protein
MQSFAGLKWYEKVRGLAAFNVTGYVRKYKNGCATVYLFGDHSQFIVYDDFGKAWRNADGYLMARRRSR